METIEEEMKRLTKEIVPLEIENIELRKEVRKLEDAGFSPPGTSAKLQAELSAVEEKYHRLQTLVKKQKEEIEMAHLELRAALEKSEKVKSLLEKEIETLRLDVDTLTRTLHQTQLQRKTVYEDLTLEERYIYSCIVEQKGIVNIAQLMRKTGYKADDIFRILDDLESKGFISRIGRE
jgi:uncharacterized membrane protein